MLLFAIVPLVGHHVFRHRRHTARHAGGDRFSYGRLELLAVLYMRIALGIAEAATARAHVIIRFAGARRSDRPPSEEVADVETAAAGCPAVRFLAFAVRMRRRGIVACAAKVNPRMGRVSVCEGGQGGARP